MDEEDGVERCLENIIKAFTTCGFDKDSLRLIESKTGK